MVIAIFNILMGSMDPVGIDAVLNWESNGQLWEQDICSVQYFSISKALVKATTILQ